MKKYAPEHENDTAGYIRFLRKKTGIEENKQIKDLTPEEFKNLLNAIEQMEGWREGSESFLKQQSIPDRKITTRSIKFKKSILAVSKNKKGIITSYLIEEIGWVSKDQGIQLTLQGKGDEISS